MQLSDFGLASPPSRETISDLLYRIGSYQSLFLIECGLLIKPENGESPMIVFEIE